MTRNIRKAYAERAVPAATGQARIRPAGQPTKPESAAGVAYRRGTGPAENDGDLADLVWKYFAEEITQALIEVQELLERAQDTTEKANK